MLVLGILLGGSCAQGQTKDTMACVVRLELPSYPILARQSWLQGRADASFAVGEDGRPTKVSVAATHELLRQAVEARLVRSVFKPECAGSRLTLKVTFQLRQPRQKYGPTEIAFIAPDMLEVVTTAPDEVPQPASPAP